jgi:hypothetical protein
VVCADGGLLVDQKDQNHKSFMHFWQVTNKYVFFLGFYVQVEGLLKDLGYPKEQVYKF